MSEFKTLTKQGLWENNPALVQLLGLCPLLAVTASVTNALGLGLATLFVLMGSNITVSLVRQWVPQEIRIPVFVMVIATFVTIIQLLMNAYVYQLYQTLGIFIPLIVTNCAIIGRAEAYASKNKWHHAAIDGLMMGLGFAAVLVVLGGIREVLGNGTLFDGAELLLGEWAKQLRIELFSLDYPLLLAILPPGAFIGMGFIIAIKNRIDAKRAQIQSTEKTVTRARVTAES
ncbi:MAG TPA: electron transport complex subunit RsxE [Idiomarina baltica]|jgi:electron transport complex protein RnfE|uniref:Ion-translocating oxidoreductase complex subunit E n=1 Tax=Idiomarina baltica TaxID=190892 RepID=A0A348WPQ1_9GAMM|nr:MULTISPECIES: electron transport complex subunit E [Idiomarina]MBL74083.1 electron transport complex subunit RsxE [Idiomarinaceae bacterium]HAR56513.1 electron transport complex subunit RsxE [Idiomarina baltica]|tara:strand:- start:3679 stop:4368 length:690 start_codon:yes stop_codon:yes gene_type:complete